VKKLIALLALICFPAFAQSVIYAGVGDGVTDNKAAMDAAQTAVCATSNRTISVPCGNYRFLTPPAAPSCAINLEGQGKACTALIKDYSGNGSYFLKRAINATDTYGGGSIRDMTIAAGPNSTDGIAIWIVASQDANSSSESKNPHGILLDNLMLGAFVGGGHFAFGIYLDGYANTGCQSGSGCAIGIRSVNIRNTSIAASSSADIYIYRAIGTSITSTECFGTPTWNLAVDGASDGTLIVSRTCAPTVINGINTYKWP